MRLPALALAVLFCAACDAALDDNAMPATHHLDRLERLLARHDCVGRLEDWERNYRFSRKTGVFSGHSLNPDLDVVEFHLRKAGTVTIRPGRNVIAPAPDGDWPDSAPMQTLDGRFSLSSGTLSVSPCGPRTRR